MIITRANSACRRANICSGVARICCEEEPSWRLCHGALTMDFRAGCSSCSTTNSFVTNAVLIERAVSCWHLHQLISQTTQILDSWLSDLLQSELKMKFLKVKEGHVPHTGNAIEHQVMKWTSKCWRWDWHKQTSYSNYSYAGRSSSFHTGTVPVSPTRSGTHRYGSQAAWPCDSSSSRVALVASRWEDPVQAVLTGSQVASGTHAGISRTFWHRLPIFQVDLHCALHRVATSSCRGHVDELATKPFLLLHREHGTGYRRSWNCRDRGTRFVVIWKHFCIILSTGTRIRIDSVMRPRSSIKGRMRQYKCISYSYSYSKGGSIVRLFLGLFLWSLFTTSKGTIHQSSLEMPQR